MEKLIINSTKNTPDVQLHPAGIIKISGRSIPDNPLQFFNPIVDWINIYIVSPAEVTTVNINLDLINADSCKYLIHLIKKVTYVNLKSKKFIIKWYYEDGNDNILEIGENIASTLDIPISIIKIKQDCKINEGVVDSQYIETKIKEKSMTQQLKERPSLITLIRSYKTLSIIITVLITIGVIVFLFYSSNEKYKGFYGNWEIKATQNGLDGYIIENISIYKSKDLTLVYVKGDFNGELVWGPLLFVAQKNKGILNVVPSKYYGIKSGMKFERYDLLNTILTQPFNIYYSSEYDRLIVGNAFFVRSKENVWNF